MQPTSDINTTGALGSESATAKSTRIRVRGLTKRYGYGRAPVTALDNVSVEVGGAEKLVLLGPSGCGKTTLLRCIAGLEIPDEGEIEIDGRLVYSSERQLNIPPERRGLSMVFQSYALWPHMTVFDNVAYPLVNMRVARKEIHERVMGVLASVGCEPYSHRYPSQLSGGQQQRIALARAIVGSDNTILFDEPLSNVDALVREQLRGELASLQRRLGFSAVYVTHDQSEALAFADRIAVMQTGRVAQIGSVRDIYESPNSRYVAGFTGAANIVRGQVTSLDGRLAAISTPFGTLHVIVEAQGQGSEVDIIIRPEHLEITEARPERNAIEARVELNTFLGVYTEYKLSCISHDLTLRSTRPGALSEGSTTWITFDPRHAVVLPAERMDG